MQIEQVGKIIQACLKVAGAKASDIVLTRAYVIDSDAFKPICGLCISVLNHRPAL